MILTIYTLVLSSLVIYSYALIDPNLTLINHPLWVIFRDKMVFLGYYERELSAAIYMVLIVLLYACHIFLVKKAKDVKINRILMVSLVLLISYPLLSHDFFNYLFDAKIVTFYHQNPYFHKALDYPADQWLRFMHWTHRTYPYGPVWLALSIIPSFLAIGKLLLNFLLFKLMFLFFYVASVLLLNQLNKRWAVFFATNPLIIIEGLVNAHNDFIAVCFGVIGVFYLMRPGLLRGSRLVLSKAEGKDSPGVTEIISRFFLMFSAGIKYITLPIIFLKKPDKKNWNLVVFLSVISILSYLTFTAEIQPWYFLNLFIFLPYFPKVIENMNIFFMGLLFSYYPYIRFGGWGEEKNVAMKHQIIIIFFIINAVVLMVNLYKNKKIISS